VQDKVYYLMREIYIFPKAWICVYDCKKKVHAIFLLIIIVVYIISKLMPSLPLSCAMKQKKNIISSQAHSISGHSQQAKSRWLTTVVALNLNMILERKNFTYLMLPELEPVVPGHDAILPFQVRRFTMCCSTAKSKDHFSLWDFIRTDLLQFSHVVG
jgi:hypothetical protein